LSNGKFDLHPRVDRGWIYKWIATREVVVFVNRSRDDDPGQKNQTRKIYDDERCSECEELRSLFLGPLLVERKWWEQSTHFQGCSPRRRRIVRWKKLLRGIRIV
jgi:hypothetical protein